MEILLIKKYINDNYTGEIGHELIKYIGTNSFLDDVERIMGNDSSIDRYFAGQCAVDQQAEVILDG